MKQYFLISLILSCLLLTSGKAFAYDVYNIPTGTQLYGSITENALTIDNFSSDMNSLSSFCSEGFMRAHLSDDSGDCDTQPGFGCSPVYGYSNSAPSWTLPATLSIPDLEFAFVDNTSNPWANPNGNLLRFYSCSNYSTCAIFSTETDFYLTFSCERQSDGQKAYPGYILLFRSSEGVWTTASSSVNGSCGSANGHSYRALPIDAGVLCSVGTPSGSIFSFDVGWIWTCYGQNGGDDAICNATFDANAQAIDAVCGDDDGQTLSSPPTDFCNSGDLITPSFISTNTGWSWTCAGTDGGQDDFCSAKNTDFIFPDIPAPVDCSAMAVPEKWFCDLTNTLKGIFLPTDDAIKTLNNTIKSVKQKAPFCYIIALQNNLAMLQVAKDTDNSAISLTFTLGTNASGDIDLNAFGTTGKLRDLMIFIKAICSFIVILIFIFWALSFTKRIFK